MKNEEKIINIIENVSSSLISLKEKGLNNIKGLNLSANHFQYISILDRLGETTSTDLAEKLGISKPAVTAFINKLLDEDIVIKTQSNDDKRFFNLRLSKKGKQVAEVYHEALLTYAKKMKSSLTNDEFGQLVNLLEKGLKG